MFHVLIAFLLAFTSLQATAFDEELAHHVTFVPGGPNHIGRIVINDRKNGITDATWIYVNAALSSYRTSKPACLILELNTPGGEVFAAQRISDALKDLDTQYGIPVIAYVNNWAISAGAMLAYSCRYIVIAKDASMGAAEPVTMGSGGEMQGVSEKITSALRTDFANRAAFFDRNPAIAEAMVDKDILLVERKGAIIKLDTEDELQNDDTLLKPKGKLLTLTSKQLIDWGVANALLEPVKLQPLTDEQLETGVWPIQQTPLSQIDFFQKLAPCTIDTYNMDWQMRFLAMLANPAVASLLLLGIIVGGYMEMSHPGVVLPGLVAAVCLFLTVLSSFAMEVSGWLELSLLGFGLAMIAVELLFMPTAGILLVVGGLFALAGLAGFLLPGIGSVHVDNGTLNVAGEYVLERLGWLAAAVLVGGAAIWLLSRFMVPRGHLLRRIVLGDTAMLATGEHAMQAKDVLNLPPLRMGDEGIVSMTLRPAGKVIVQGGEFDVVSNGGYVERGTRVRVVQIEGARIVVEVVT